MRRFKDLLKNKFVWGPKDVEHEPKPKKETKEERANKFIWRHGDLEHHDIKESLDEKWHVPHDAKGNFNNPHEIKHSPYDMSHPYNKGQEPGNDAHAEFEAHHDNLDDDERSVIHDYKGSGYKDINEHLRTAYKNFKKERSKHFKNQEKGIKYKEDDHKDLKKQKQNITHHHDHDENDDEPSEDDYKEHHLDNTIHHLDNVTNHRTTEDHKVYRGGHPGDKTKFPIGHEFTDHGYASTSFRKSTAQGFSGSHKTGKKDQHGWEIKKAHVHVIHVPKGSRGHYLDVKGNDSDHSNSEEKEFLLHRGTRFKVTHHSEDASTHYIHSRVVKQGIRHKFSFQTKQQGADQPKDAHGLPGQHKFPFMKHHKRFK